MPSIVFRSNGKQMIPDLHFNRDDYKHRSEIELQYGQLDFVLNWAQQNLDDDYRIVQGSFNLNSGTKYTFYFKSSEDCVLFSLKWC
jgi:hypothetical protein